MLILILGLIALIGLLIAVWAISTFNRFVKLKVLVEEAWSGIDVQLKKRYNLIPNLIETVKGYAAHEKETFESVTQARSNAQNAQTVHEQQVAENQLNKSLMNLFAVAEQYPDLKANVNFLELQKQLTNIEDDIEKARRYYNGTVRDKNILVESFPSNILAGLFNFGKSEFFEIDIAQKEVPRVKF